MIKKRMNINKVIKTFGVITILFILSVGFKYPAMSESASKESVLESQYPAMSNYPILVRQRLHEQLVVEVKNYLQKMAPTTKLSPEELVSLCEEYDVDITFVLAQGLIESHFGTKGRAAGVKSANGKSWVKKPTNSVWNVGTWDGKEAIYVYKTQNESIEPFLKLLKDDYLSARTMRQLLNDGGYKNKNGHRYASNPLYEQNLRSTIANINVETSIKMYQDVMNLSDSQIVAYFSPRENAPTKLTAKLN